MPCDKIKIMSSNAKSVLPAPYAGWMDELLGGPIPMEIEATCDDCAMCADSSIRPGDLDFVFNSKTKCCTYIPELPDFLVGCMLNNENSDFAAGRVTHPALIINDEIQNRMQTNLQQQIPGLTQ